MIYCMLICCKDILSALRWFSFIFRAGSLCPDTIGPQGHDRWLELMQGMPTLDFANVAGHVQRVFAAEPSDLWALVREACSVSVLLALTAFSAALQRRVGLLGPEAQAASLAEAWGAFGGVLGELLGRVGRARALTDATGVPLLAPEDVVRIWSGWMGFQARDSGLEVAEQALEQAQGAYYATEDLYFARLRPRLLEGCGAVCDLSLQREEESNFWIPHYRAEVEPRLAVGSCLSRWPPMPLRTAPGSRGIA